MQAVSVDQTSVQQGSHAAVCRSTNNKGIGDNTKSATRQSLNCIKIKKYKIWRKTIFNMADGILTPCNVACGSGIVKVNSPSDSEFTKWQHPAMWYVALGWHAIEFAQTSAILEFYIWFPFLHITTVDMSFCTSLWNFIQIGPPSAEKNDDVSIFKMAISAILDCRDPIMGSLKSPVKRT